MSLLDAITNASAALAAGRSPRPTVHTPSAPPPLVSSSLPTWIPPSTWSLAFSDPSLETAASFLAASLASCSSASVLRILLNNFLSKLALSLSLPPLPRTIPEAVRALAPYFPAAVASHVASAAARTESYEVLLALAESRLLPHPSPDLVSSLADSGRADLVFAVLRHATDLHSSLADSGCVDLFCAVLRQAKDLRSSEILAGLRRFLSPASEEAYDAMMDMKSRWKDAAVAAVDRCRNEGAEKVVNDAARRAALLLMMGHDGFSSPEVCLHYLFASGNVDSVVLGAAVAELDGDEVVRLMRYLNKWIEKYGRFPEAQPCPEGVDMLGLEQCDCVPPFGVVVSALGVVLDNHFSHLVLNADVRGDLKAADKMLKELAAEAESSGPILDLLCRLHQSE